MKKILLLFFILTARFSIAQTALEFNGSIPNYVQVGNSMNTVLSGTNTITVEAWCYLTSYSFLPTIVGNYGSGMQFLLRVDNNRAAFWVDNGTFRVVNGATIVPLNTWTHIAGVWDGSSLRVYINGVLDGTITGIAGTFNATTNPVRIGTSLTSEPWNGKLDDVRIWSVARSATDITSTMNNCVTGAEPGLLALYEFEEGSGNTVADLTGNGYNGTLVNSPVWTPGLGCLALPVNFKSIQAAKSNNGIIVSWEVAAEEDIVKYEIERSSNGSIFIAVGSVPASQLTFYKWIDRSQLGETSYYRVKSLHVSGSVKYSGVTRMLAGNETSGIIVAPNPVEGSKLHLQFKNNQEGIYRIQLTNAAGKVLLVKSIQHTGGISTQTIPLPSNIRSGIYHLTVIDPGNGVTGQSLLIGSANN